MRINIFIIILILSISCSRNKEIDEEIIVIGHVYNTIPKVIPPIPIQSNEFDSIGIKIDYSKRDSLYFNYAIYKQFNNNVSGLNKEVNKSFFKPNSKKLFEREDIDSSSMALIRKIGTIDSEYFINDELLNNYVGKNLFYINEKFLKKNGKEKKEHNITGIINFSRVSFNTKKNRPMHVSLHLLVVSIYF